MKSKILIFLGMGLLTGPMAANAVPSFNNASFETGDATGWNVINPMFTVVPTGGVQSSWFAAQDGNYSVWFGAVDVGAGSSYNQSVGGFIVGDLYEITFGMLPEHGSTYRTGRTEAATLLSLVGADVASQSFAADCTNPNDGAFFNCAPGWQDMSMTFTALSSSIDFTWTADLVRSPGSWEFGFDNIRLENVPEPSTLALLGLGLFGIGAARRKKHNV